MTLIVSMTTTTVTARGEDAGYCQLGISNPGSPYSQDEVELPDQQDQPDPTHDPDIRPSKDLANRFSFRRNIDRPPLRTAKVGRLYVAPSKISYASPELPKVEI